MLKKDPGHPSGAAPHAATDSLQSICRIRAVLIPWLLTSVEDRRSSARLLTDSSRLRVPAARRLCTLRRPGLSSSSGSVSREPWCGLTGSTCICGSNGRQITRVSSGRKPSASSALPVISSFAIPQTLTSRSRSLFMKRTVLLKKEVAYEKSIAGASYPFLRAYP